MRDSGGVHHADSGFEHDVAHASQAEVPGSESAEPGEEEADAPRARARVSG